MSNKTQIRGVISLPENFRSTEFLALHQRDQEQIAEKVEQSTLSKGIYWSDFSACLSVHLTDKEAQVELLVDGEVPVNNQRLIDCVKKMLGLSAPSNRATCDPKFRFKSAANSNTI